MKNITCCAGALFLLNIGLYQSQALSLKDKKISFETNEIPASEAVRLLFSKYNIENISPVELAGYKTGKVTCKEIPVVDCLKKILHGMPFEISLYKDNTVFIRNKSLRFGNNTVDSFEEQNLLIKNSDTVRRKEYQIEEITLNAGYYKVKEKERTGSIARVAAKDIENQPVNNVLSSLQGRMAGVNITQNSGVAGGGFDVQIRGRNSLRNNGTGDLNASRPLYVIDGVPVSTTNSVRSNMTDTILPFQDANPLNNINPDDIESIEVLKDADATAIYGSKGANGVILISTKKGKSGKTEVSITSTYGLGDVSRSPKMMNTQQYLQMRKDAFANDGITTYPVNAYDINGTWDKERYTNWQQYFIGNTSERTSTKAQVTGGNQNTQFLLSAGHDQETTVFPGDYRYKRTTIGVNLNHQSTNKKLKINFSGYYTLQNNFLPPTDFSSVYATLTPNAPALFTSNNTLNWENSTFANPLAAATRIYKMKSEQLISNMVLSYQLAKGLSFTVNGGYTRNTSDEKTLAPKTIYNPALNFGSEMSSIRIANPNQYNWIAEPQLNYEHQWNNHKLQVLVGGSFQSQSSSSQVLTADSFPSDELIENIGSAATIRVDRSGAYNYGYQAFYGRANYQLASRYIVNFTGRRDGSSRFGANRRYANFAAAGLAWIFSQENFLKDVKWLSFGKLRGSYGSAGSDLIGDYQFYDTYRTTSTPYNSLQGLLLSRLYNPDFSWEVTHKLEIGMELGFLKDRINLGINWYKNRSSNQLVGIPLSLVTGFSSYQGNLKATVENKGWEFSLQSSNIKHKDFSWATSLNLSIPKNELIEFPNLQGSTYANTFVIGYSTNVRKLYHFLGVDPNTGLYQFEDKNGDGKLDINDQYIVKEIGTEWYGGIVNNFKYKSFELSILFQLSKQSQFNLKSNSYGLGNMKNLPEEFLDYWRADRPNATYQKPSSGANPAAMAATINFVNSDAIVSDVFSFRLRNISLRYTIPGDILKVLRATVFLEGQNLAVWTNLKGLDPEASLGFLPPLRVISFGTTLKF
ncbi:SusC/RagA family TonB-linked outer membrane protein [Chryseobacterium gwangjuense]|uniref:SusC/RagA family TonB-linked outer membrane protein n=1 Tax=Chryseobacterium gwangjuense TaxID=1069980 RepID=UPI001E57BBD3|nr:SusC/RagA family TonB-linked outer membrane protein [Chryseobacterium gwangjuense]MCE3074162.1 SusC/RagA family TonB-linked outer membrane protein [Chryseobacterium gwangjuense]